MPRAPPDPSAALLAELNAALPGLGVKPPAQLTAAVTRGDHLTLTFSHEFQPYLASLSALDELTAALSPAQAARETRRRSGDWSEVRPEWGLSGNAAFIIGRRELTRGVCLDGRVFLQSYDYLQDPSGRLLEIVMTGPQAVGQWINMEHYFSTVDNEVYGSGTKIYHNVVGRFGVMSGPQSDLRTGLAWQTVMDGPRPFHEPMRMLTLIEAPREQVLRIIGRHRFLQRLYDNEWVHLAVLEPEEKVFYRYFPQLGWTPIKEEVRP